MQLGYSRAARIEVFKSSVAKLSGASLIGQMVPVLIMPVLTRQYSKEAFGIQALFLAALAVISPIGTLKLELAILQAAEISTVAVLSRLCVIQSILSAACLISVGFLINSVRPNFYGFSSFWFFFYLGNALVLICALNVTTHVLLRAKRFTTLAISRVVQSLCLGASSVLCGFTGLQATGLIFAGIFSSLCALLWHIFTSSRELEPITENAKVFTKEIAMRFFRYPAYICPAAVVNSLALVLAVPAMAMAYGPSVAGEFSLAHRITLLPITLIGAAVSQVFLAKLSEATRLNNHLGSYLLFTQYRRKLIGLSVILLLFGVMCPFLFKYIFGRQWEMAGWYAGVLTIPSAMQLIVSPLSSIVYQTDQHRLQLFLDLARLIFISLGFWISFQFWQSPHISVLIIAGTQALSYTIFAIVYDRIAITIRLRNACYGS